MRGLLFLSGKPQYNVSKIFKKASWKKRNDLYVACLAVYEAQLVKFLHRIFKIFQGTYPSQKFYRFKKRRY